MTQLPFFLIHTILPGNADHGAGQRVPRTAWVHAGTSMELADGADPPLNASSEHPWSLPGLAQRPRQLRAACPCGASSGGGRQQSP
jgi:hypothetical protein